MKFNKDIFISYAHIDDEPMIPGEPGWISELHRSLELRLSQLLGYRPVIWRDKHLTGNDQFGNEIIQQLNEIAILVSVHSPRYIKSEWCMREVTEFYKISENNIGAFIGNKCRILKVIKTPVELSHQAEIIQGLLGYEFYKMDADSGRAVEYGNLYGKEYQLAYWSKLNDLAYDIAALLTEIEKKKNAETALKPVQTLSTPAAGSATKTNDGVKAPQGIYLAETSSDIKENREAIKRHLSEKGYQVLPDKNLPLEAHEYETDVNNALRCCELSVHMIGSNFGLVPEGTNKSRIQLQNEIAAALSSEKKMPRVIWMPAEIRAGDERQSAFLEELKRSDRLLSGADLLIGPLEDLKFAIEDKLQKPEQETNFPESGKEDGNGVKKIYLICDQPDSQAIRPVEDALFNKGFEVIIPAFDGDQTELRLDHQENLKSCDAVLIYYGAGNELWLRAKTRDLMKAAGYGRRQPLKVKTVCVAEPLTPQKERFRSHEVQVISIAGNNLEAIDEFVKELET